MDFVLNNIEVIGIILIILLYIYCSYRSLKIRQIKVREARASVEVQLKKRYDLIPNILTIAKKYMVHENQLFNEIANLRVEAMQQHNQDANARLQSSIRELLLNAENYPELKANSLLLQSQSSYNEIEEYISAARRFLNASITEFKNKAEIFPSNLFAKIFNIKIEENFFETKEQEKEVIDAGKYL